MAPSPAAALVHPPLPIDVGARIWISDAEEVWRVVEIVSYAEDVEKGTVLQVDGKFGRETLNLRDIGDLFRVNPHVVDDITSLHYIHEAGILENLYARSRPANLKPYTLMGAVLIAVNPLKHVAGPNIQDYIDTQTGDRAPHPFTIAEVAFQQMVLRSPAQCQSIVISGESGAGKTETSKIMLGYLASRERMASQAVGSKKPSKQQANVVVFDESQAPAIELDKRLLDTNPILEALGNAKTLRNHNSSRFGKFMKMQYQSEPNKPKKYELCGAVIETYLLEKSRVVTQIEGERNFHVFYFLLAGADEQLRVGLQLERVDHFKYLNTSGCVQDPNVSDKQLFNELVSAFSTVGIDESLQKQIWRVLSGILHLGNLQLEGFETPAGTACAIVAEAERNLQSCANLLGVDAARLTRVITTREIFARGEIFTKKRSAEEGGYVRDAIAKSIYSSLFKWILGRINKSLGHCASSLPFIGVLDIFGFESFQKNDYEQLLINYTNEVLQSTFNEQVFVTEQELFAEEGIDVGEITWQDNRECIHLISSTPNGLLPMLDEESRMPKPTDEKWNSKLHKTHACHGHFLRLREQEKRLKFVIRHYAADVTYTIGNFTSKNTDTIPKNLEVLVQSSQLPILTKLLVNPRKGRSESSEFTAQLGDLAKTLSDTRCNFVRCIKPNAAMSFGEFDHNYVVDQLRCTGVLATCELLKVGLPTRVSYEEICSIYKSVLPPSITSIFVQFSARTFTEAVLWSFYVDVDAYRLGRTRLFFKSGKISLLSALLKVDQDTMDMQIVPRLNKWCANRRWRFILAWIRAIQWLGKCTMKRKVAVVKMQATFRMYTVQKTCKKLRRKTLLRKRMKTIVNAVIAGNAFKALLLRTRSKLMKQQAARVNASIKIQTIVRSMLERKKVTSLVAAHEAQRTLSLDAKVEEVRPAKEAASPMLEEAFAVRDGLLRSIMLLQVATGTLQKLLVQLEDARSDFERLEDNAEPWMFDWTACQSVIERLHLDLSTTEDQINALNRLRDHSKLKLSLFTWFAEWHECEISGFVPLPDDGNLADMHTDWARIDRELIDLIQHRQDIEKQLVDAKILRASKLRYTGDLQLTQQRVLQLEVQCLVAKQQSMEAWIASIHHEAYVAAFQLSRRAAQRAA